MFYHTVYDCNVSQYEPYLSTQKVSEYDQEIPQSHTAEQPLAACSVLGLSIFLILELCLVDNIQFQDKFGHYFSSENLR